MWLAAAYFGGSIFMLSLCTSTTVLILNIHHRGVYRTPVPRWARVFVLDWLANILRLSDRIQHLQMHSKIQEKVRACTHTHTHTNTHTHVRMHTHVRTCTHVHARTRTHMHTSTPSLDQIHLPTKAFGNVRAHLSKQLLSYPSRPHVQLLQFHPEAGWIQGAPGAP